eukprot:scaffold5303_cov97-Skeletonema_dohrnii-CCMP3373.AAC.2
MMIEHSGMFDVSAIDDDVLDSVMSFEQDIPTTRKDTTLSSCGWLLGYSDGGVMIDNNAGYDNIAGGVILGDVVHSHSDGGLLGSGDGGEVIGCGHGKMGGGITLGDVVADGLGMDASDNNSSQGGRKEGIPCKILILPMQMPYEHQRDFGNSFIFTPPMQMPYEHQRDIGNTFTPSLHCILFTLYSTI